ncbi:hypothetical protein AU080_05445 [Streptococcus equinus]|nr:hypothetical protein AU080_05445 [Streptococcus equinus]
MYSEDSKKKVYYLLSDIVALVVSYLILAQNDLNTDLMFKMEDDPRIFPFGHKLRDWSLDELPQFINVLKGRNNIIQITGRIDDFILVV